MTQTEELKGFASRLDTSDRDMFLRMGMPDKLRKGAQVRFADAVALLVSGVVAAEVFSDHRHGFEASALSFYGPGDLLGLEAALCSTDDGLAELSTSYTVRSADASVRVLSREGFRKFAAGSCSVAIMEEQAARLHQVSRERLWASLPTFDRVRIFLIDMAHRFKRTNPDGTVEIDVPLTQADIALAVGASRQAIELQMTRLREHGLITPTSRYRQLILSPKLFQMPLPRSGRVQQLIGKGRISDW